MPFILSLRPQDTEIKLPHIEYKDFQTAYHNANEILKKFKGLYFVGVFYFDEQTSMRNITSLIQYDFKPYSWTQYKYFDKINRIKDFFVLNGQHYLKLKTYQS